MSGDRPEDTHFVLIRHAETEWNAAGRWQGHGDAPLTTRGLEQSERLAEELAAARIDRLVCSDLRRCQQTAAPLAARLELEVELMAGLRELDVGSWSGLSRAEIAKIDPETLRRFDAGETVRPGGGETRAELASRVHALVEALAADSPGRHFAVVTHSGVVKTLRPGAQVDHARPLGMTLAEIRENAASKRGSRS